MRKNFIVIQNLSGDNCRFAVRKFAAIMEMLRRI